MMLKIACPCGHTGIVSAETLPRELTCSRCGASRHVGSGERIVNKVAVLEWLLGGAEEPLAAAGAR
jgi:hypothetical protein